MRRPVQLAASALFLGGIAWLLYTYRADLGLPGHLSSQEGPNSGLPSGKRPSPTAWQTVDRSADGFKVEMPASVTETQVPAYNDRGVVEPARMIEASADSETIFAVAWAENPPVQRANSGDGTDKTLDLARDGALVRTQTTLVGESRSQRYGYPARDFSARNANGGILNARLVLAGPRLYLLVATFPNAAARRDDDVNRFFGSFSLTSAAPPSQRTE